MPKKQEAPVQAAPGPKPESLKIDGDWQDAIKLSFEEKKPIGGWPK